MEAALGLDGTFPLTADHASEIRRVGWTVLRQVLSPEELSRLAPALREYVHVKQEALVPSERAMGASATDTVFSMDDAPDEVVSFVTSSRLGGIAANLLGVRAVRLLHFCGFFKPAGGPGTPWHQDLTFIPLDTDKVLSLWVPLADVEADMGVLKFAGGSHLGGPLRESQHSNSYKIASMPPLRAGDLSAHLGWTAHASAPNTSSQAREAIALCYYMDGARVSNPNVAFAERLIESYFSGLRPGDAAVGTRNPVVFEAHGV